MNAHDGGTAHSALGFAHPERNVRAFSLQPGMVVADFGAGSGAYVFAMAEALGNVGHVFAVDVQKDLLRRIHSEAQRRGLDTVSIVWGDVEAAHGSKIADASVDRVLISNMLFQAEHKNRVLKEAMRILKDDGQLYVIEWSDSFGGLGPQKQDIVTEDALLEIADREGFEATGRFRAGAHHYGVRFRKTVQHSPHIDV